MGQPLTNARNWYNATEEIGSGSGGSVSAWGDLTGTLSDQTDLQSALDDKADATHAHAGSDITSGTVAPAYLGTGSSISTKYLRGDGTWQTLAGGVTAMSDLSDVGTVTPTDKHAVVGNGTAFGSRQLASTDLSDVSAATGADDDFLQRKSGAWTNRTIAQVKTDLAASTSTAGVVELAIDTEVTAGSSAALAVTPDALAGSTIFGVKSVQIPVFAPTTDCATGDGKAYFVVPACLNGMNLVGVVGRAITAGTTGTMDVQIANVTDAVDMLSTKLTWDSTEASTSTAATAAVIDTTKDDVATNDLLRIDVDAVQTTAAKGMIIVLNFQLP